MEPYSAEERLALCLASAGGATASHYHHVETDASGQTCCRWCRWEPPVAMVEAVKATAEGRPVEDALSRGHPLIDPTPYYAFARAGLTDVLTEAARRGYDEPWAATADIVADIIARLEARLLGPEEHG